MRTRVKVRFSPLREFVIAASPSELRKEIMEGDGKRELQPIDDERAIHSGPLLPWILPLVPIRR